MKLFAKRSNTRKDAVSAKETSSTPKTFQSDAVVEELLKQNDPASWNAKQRRMIKRYQQRNITTKSSSTTDDEPKEDIAVTEDTDPVIAKDDIDGSKESPKESEENDSIKGDNDDSSSSSSSAESIDDESSDDATISNDNDDDDKTTETKEELNNNKSEKFNDGLQQAEQEDEAEAAKTKLVIDKELQEMLDKLNSKNRRKLTRMLERATDDTSSSDAIEVVRAQAASLLEITDGDVDIDKKRCRNESTTASEELSPDQKKQRRRNKQDWSTLPAAERLRREEQRRLQVEAAAARQTQTVGNGASSKKYRHPLNSERRRANRRKPKWLARNQIMSGDEHNATGYHMRKVTRGGNAA